MVEHEDASFVAECFWPGVVADDLDALDRRVRKAVADLARGGLHVGYLGSILMAEDEVVLCQFEGTAAAVREAAERAQIPFERIVEAFRPSTQTADRD
jgi:hypothetical protein